MASKVYELSDRAMGGKLPFLLRKWRSEKLSCERIARKLESEHGIDVTGRTVSNWLDALDSENGAKQRRREQPHPPSPASPVSARPLRRGLDSQGPPRA